jgi:leader peptidase (prepilin peptidase)/N-methyltransferase
MNAIAASPWVVAAGVAVFATFGSFLAALAARQVAGILGEPTYAGRSFLWGRSICPACGTGLGAADLWPVVSWLIRRGRCRACGAPISADYLVIEAGSILAFLVAWSAGSAGLSLLALAVLGAVLVALAVVDLRHQLLPDAMVLPLLPLGLAVAWSAQGTDGIVLHGAGALLGGGLLWSVRALHRRIRGIEGLGFGDVKLMAVGGVWAGPGGIAPILLLAALGTLAFVGVGAVLGRHTGAAQRIPFGPGLAAAIYLWVLGGAWIGLELRLV